MPATIAAAGSDADGSIHLPPLRALAFVCAFCVRARHYNPAISVACRPHGIVQLGSSVAAVIAAAVVEAAAGTEVAQVETKIRQDRLGTNTKKNRQTSVTWRNVPARRVEVLRRERVVAAGWAVRLSRNGSSRRRSGSSRPRIRDHRLLWSACGCLLRLRFIACLSSAQFRYQPVETARRALYGGPFVCHGVFNLIDCLFGSVEFRSQGCLFQRSRLGDLLLPGRRRRSGLLRSD